MKAGRDGWGLGAAEIARGGTCVIKFFDFVSSAHGLLIRLFSLSFLISHPCLFLYPKMWARAWGAGAYDVTAGQRQPPGLLEVCGLSFYELGLPQGRAGSGSDLRGVWTTSLLEVARCVCVCVCTQACL